MSDSEPFSIDRRDFLKALGGGIIIFLYSGIPAYAQRSKKSGASPPAPSDFNAYLRIGESGRVTCFTGKIEMGQGIVTALAQILAEELEVPLRSIDMTMGDTDLCPWDMGTFGSRSIKHFGPELREAAATAKAVLIELAAESLKVPKDRLATKDGMVFDRQGPDRKVSYAALAKGKSIEKRAGVKGVLKPLSEYTVSGKPVNRTDALEKVTGKALYAGDIRLPEMLYAKILRPRAHGATLSSVDLSEAEKAEGVQIVRDSDFIAVLHAHPDAAERALGKIKVEFRVPKDEVDDRTIFDALAKKKIWGETVAAEGSQARGKRVSKVLFNETYRTRYVAHAPIEPHTATAMVEKDKITIWASTQRPFGAREEVAGAMGVPTENVRIVTPFVGGGFGGKTRGRQIVEAAKLAKAAGKPVQVAWSRQEEFFYDTFQPAAIVKIDSGLDGSNRISFWDYTVYFAGSRESHAFYTIPDIRTVSHGSWQDSEGVHPFEVGAWRAPGCNTNTFARESHIDVMAARAGQDPVKFRLGHLRDKRMRKVLEAAADGFGWSSGKFPSGKGRGVACSIYQGTCVTAMAEVRVDEESKKIKVQRLVCSVDMGKIINPQGAKLQIEGCLTMGLGYALTEEIRFSGREVLDQNFDTYEIPRFSWVPEIETVLVDNPEVPPQGCGEPAITCVGAVIANAVFDATGIRMRELPMTPERIEEAKKQG
jgi:isoquinoline 1-oxidoreductase